MNQHVTLHVDGKRIEYLAVNRLMCERRINQIPTATLTLKPLADTRGGLNPQLQAELQRCQPGADFTLTLDNQPLFSGQLVRRQLRLRGEQTTLTLEARHPLQKLVPVPRSQLFQGKDDAAIFRAVLSGAGLRASLPSLQQLRLPHEQRVQFRCSDWQFLRSRLLASGCWLLPDAAGKGVSIAPLGQMSARRHQLARQADGARPTLHDVDLSIDDRFKLDEVALQEWDIRQQKLGNPLKSRASKAASAALPGGTIASHRRSWSQAFSTAPQPSLAAFAQSRFDHHQLTALRGSLEVDGSVDYQPGDGLTLRGFGDGLDGTHVLTGVRHLCESDTGWRTQLLVGLPPTSGDPEPRIQELHVGVVEAFRKDRHQLDRIPILVPALGLKGKTLFARLGKPYASRQSGFCFYPEKGDEVIVGFFECDPGYPVILGAMHNPKNSAPFGPDPANRRKAIVLNPQDKQQQLALTAADVALSAQQIALDGEKTLALKSQDLSLTAAASLTMTGKTAAVTGTDSLSLDAKAATLTGSNTLTLQSKNINLKK